MSEYHSTDDDAIYTLVPVSDVADWADVDQVSASFAVLRREVVPFDKVTFNAQGDGTVVVAPKPAPQQPKLTVGDDGGGKYYTQPEGDMLRIVAARTFRDMHRRTVTAGQKGGLISCLNNLSQHDSCWISENSVVDGDSAVFGNACVSDSSRIGGNVRVSGNACISGSIITADGVEICGNASVQNSTITGRGYIQGSARINTCDLALKGDSVEGHVDLIKVTFEADRYALTLRAGRFEGASLRHDLEVFSVNCEHGSLQFFPVRVGSDRLLQATVGCQTACSAEQLLAIARRNDLLPWRHDQLTLLIQAGAKTGEFFGAANLDDWTLPSGV